jgi:type IV secretory pathway VirB4 component
MNLFLLAAWALVFVVAGLILLALRCIPRMPYSLKHTRQATASGFDELIVPEYLISCQPSITLNEDGAFTTGFRLTGPDATTKSEEAMARVVNDLNAVFSSADVGWMYELQRVRKPMHIIDTETFLPTATHRVLHGVRSIDCYVDEMHLLVTYLPPEGMTSLFARLLVRGEMEDIEKSGQDTLAEGLRILENGCRMIEIMLKSCMITVERFKGAGHRDDLVDTLFKNINGWSLPGLDLPELRIDADTGLLCHPVQLRECFAVQDFIGGLSLKYGREHIRLLSLATFPPSRRPRLLAELGTLAIPYRDHSRLIMGHPDEMLFELQRRFNDAADDAKPIGPFENGKEVKTAAEAEIAKRRVSKDALTRMDELQNVIAEHQSGVRKHAWYSRIIEIRSEDPNELDRWERAIVETLRKARFGVRVESFHAVDAWLSTHGGNGYNFVRRTAAHGVTVSDIANITDAWQGRQTIKCDKCRPGTQPMLWARRADTLAPFAIDLHAGEGDVMSSIVVGPVRFGKTTLVNTIIGHFCKEERDRVVGIDYLRGEERTVVMLEGSYGAPGDTNAPARLSPFTAIDTIDGRRRAVEWCELVATLNLPEAPSGELNGRFTEAIDFLRSSPSWETEACVTLFLQKLSAPREVKEAFKHYADGGIYGHIFDATPVEMHSWQRTIRVYDTTTLHSLSERAMFPALMLLCADTVREVDGRRVLLVIEEAHIPLKHAVMAPWLITLLRTKRKQHLGIVFVLTDLEGIPEEILRTLKSLCGTVFATQNPNANATRKAYEFLDFPAKIIDAIIPSRNFTTRTDGMSPMRYPYWQLGEDGIAEFVLDLTPEELEVFARGNDKDKACTAMALREYPEAVPAAIFEHVGLNTAALAWRAHQDELRSRKPFIGVHHRKTRTPIEAVQVS